jgi:four helix bundle protein
VRAVAPCIGQKKNIFHITFLISHLSLDLTRKSIMPAAEEGRPMNGKLPGASQIRADALEERLIDFAVRIIHLANNLPRTSAGKHIAGQILRSGTSPAPNYGEARGAESHADFIHKLRIVLKELNETSIWLRIIERSLMLKRELIADIIDENKQLCRIFTASLKTGSRQHG